MKRDPPFRLAALGWPVFTSRPAFGDSDPRQPPEHVAPSESEQFRKAKCSRRTGQHQNAVQDVRQALQDSQGLLRGEQNGLVAGRAARLDRLHGIAGDKFVQASDLVNAQHGAAHFRDGRPGKLVIVVEGLQPALNVEGFDAVRDFLSPSGNEIGANDVFGVKDGAFGLGADSIRSKVIFQVLFGKGRQIGCGFCVSHR